MGNAIGLSDHHHPNSSSVYGNSEIFAPNESPEHYAILGFATRAQAHRLLQGHRKGTFITRFSSECGCLAVTYVKEDAHSCLTKKNPDPISMEELTERAHNNQHIKSFLVRPSRFGHTGWECTNENDNEVTYSKNFGDLIMKTESLKYCYPGADKEKVFTFEKPM